MANYGVTLSNQWVDYLLFGVIIAILAANQCFYQKHLIEARPNHSKYYSLWRIGQLQYSEKGLRSCRTQAGKADDFFY